MKLLDEVIEDESLRSRAPASLVPTRSAPSKATRPSQTAKSEKRPKFKVAGAFAGVGGLERGFEQAGHSSTMLCEFDPAARHVLSRHFPDAEITEDVRALTELPDCDVLTAGFPCQDLSQVGRRQLFLRI